jgi:hypothetical protein
MDALIEGFRVILAGNGLDPAGLCPPQAGNKRKKKIAMTTPAHRTQPNLPMQPLVAARGIRGAIRSSDDE